MLLSIFVSLFRCFGLADFVAVIVAVVVGFVAAVVVGAVV